MQRDDSEAAELVLAYLQPERTCTNNSFSMMRRGLRDTCEPEQLPAPTPIPSNVRVNAVYVPPRRTLREVGKADVLEELPSARNPCGATSLDLSNVRTPTRRSLRDTLASARLQTIPTPDASTVIVKLLHMGVKVYSANGVEVQDLDEEKYNYHWHRGELDEPPPWLPSFRDKFAQRSSPPD